MNHLVSVTILSLPSLLPSIPESKKGSTFNWQNVHFGSQSPSHSIMKLRCGKEVRGTREAKQKTLGQKKKEEEQAPRSIMKLRSGKRVQNGARKTRRAKTFCEIVESECVYNGVCLLDIDIKERPTKHHAAK